MKAAAFFSLLLLACRKEPLRSTPADAAPPPPLPPPSAYVVPIASNLVEPRPLPEGYWRANPPSAMTLRIEPNARIEIEAYTDGIRAPLVITGPYARQMDMTGLFFIRMTVGDMRRLFLSKCIDCKHDVNEPVTHGTLIDAGVDKDDELLFTLRFWEGDRLVELCVAEAVCKQLRR